MITMIVEINSFWNYRKNRFLKRIILSKELFCRIHNFVEDIVLPNRSFCRSHQMLYWFLYSLSELASIKRWAPLLFLSQRLTIWFPFLSVSYISENQQNGNTELNKIFTFLIVTLIIWLLIYASYDRSVKNIKPFNSLPIDCDCAEIGNTINS
jgi:hypothetical protein